MERPPIIFIALANDLNRFLPNLSRELYAVETILEPIKQKGLCDVIVRSYATWDGVTEIFQSEYYRNRFSLFHFAGHSEGQYLIFESEEQSLITKSKDNKTTIRSYTKKIDITGFAEFIAQQSPPPIIVLNACSTEQHVRMLLNKGIPCVIATKQDIDDALAAKFAQSFYRGLSGGAELFTTFKEAKAKILAEVHESNKVPWEIYYIANKPDILKWKITVQQTESKTIPRITEAEYNNFKDYTFVGRDDEISNLYQILKSEEFKSLHRNIIIVHGMAGVGKNFLIYKVLKELVTEGYYPEGQVYLDLKRYVIEKTPSNHEQALKDLIQQFSVSPNEKKLSQHWQEVIKNKNIVLFLDNAEYSSTVFINNILPSDFNRNTCTTIIASRKNLPLSENFKRCPLEKMETEEAEELLTAIANKEEKRLTIEQAKDIAETLGYLPLALNIAATLLFYRKALIVNEFISQLKDESTRLSSLTLVEDEGDRLDEKRNLSVETSLNVSVTLIGRDSKGKMAVDVWKKLSIFSGSFSEDAVKKIGKFQGTINDLLSTLESHTLIQLVKANNNRYKLHNLLHSLASKKLKGSLHDNELHDLHFRHAQYYFQVLKTANETYKRGDLKGLERFDTERDNIYQAYRWLDEQVEKYTDELKKRPLYLRIFLPFLTELLDFKQKKEICNYALNYYLVAGVFLHLRIGTDESIKWIETSQKALKYFENTYVHVFNRRKYRKEVQEHSSRQFGALGTVYGGKMDSNNALKYHTQSLRVTRKLKDKEQKRIRLCNIGIVYDDLGCYKKSIKSYKLALQFATDFKGKIALYNNLSVSYRMIGQSYKALECLKHCEEALKSLREHKNIESEANMLCNKGNCYADLEEYDEAIVFYNQAIKLAEYLGFQTQKASILDSLARVHIDKADYPSAVEYAKQGLEIAKEIVDYRTLSENYGAIALAYFYMEKLSDAQEAIKLAEEYDVVAYTHALKCLHGMIALRQNRFFDAKEYFEEALKKSQYLLNVHSENYAARDSNIISSFILTILNEELSLKSLNISNIIGSLSFRAQRLLKKCKSEPYKL